MYDSASNESDIGTVVWANSYDECMVRNIKEWFWDQ